MITGMIAFVDTPEAALVVGVVIAAICGVLLRRRDPADRSLERFRLWAGLFVGLVAVVSGFRGLVDPSAYGPKDRAYDVEVVNGCPFAIEARLHDDTGADAPPTSIPARSTMLIGSESGTEGDFRDDVLDLWLPPRPDVERDRALDEMGEAVGMAASSLGTRSRYPMEDLDFTGEDRKATRVRLYPRDCG